MQEYKMRTNTGVEYTALLSDKEAKARGLIGQPENKKGIAENKAVSEKTPESTDETKTSNGRRPGAAQRKR